MKKAYLLLSLIAVLFYSGTFAQDLSAIAGKTQEKSKNNAVISSFKNFKIVNAQTPMTVPKGNLEFCIAHRFGDVGGNSGGIHTLFGFYSIADILFSFDYGISDKLSVGVGVYKGIGPFQQSYYGDIKYKLLEQTTDNRVPLFISLYGDANMSTMVASTDPSSDAAFGSVADRLSYLAQAIIARKFTQQFSFEILPTYLHRNFVLNGDENDLFSLGVGARYRITKRFSIIADYFHTFSTFRTNAATDFSLPNGTAFFDPIGVGIEIETGGHVFTINFTNSTGIVENEFLPYTTSSWTKGQFRLGFNIGRDFLLTKKAQSSY